jgi:large subunit ribosomal protein L18
MNRLLKKQARIKRIKKGIRKRLTGTAEKPRLSVYRSNTEIYAQLIDDIAGVTILSTTSLQLKGEENAQTRVDKAKKVGMLLAEKAKEKNIEQVVFDRNGFLYHGRVKALAEGAREGGLNF